MAQTQEKTAHVVRVVDAPVQLVFLSDVVDPDLATTSDRPQRMNEHAYTNCLPPPGALRVLEKVAEPFL